MGVKKLKITEDFPVEEGKIYLTKFQTKERFQVIKITLDKKGKQVRVEGIYENSKHLGLCPISIDRLVLEKKVIEEKDVCDCCSLPLSEPYSGKKFNDF
jgi:hypothetical protein